MKNTKLYISLLSITLIGLTSCKNDLQVLAPGEESVSIYGILNPNETTQNIRINKVYLTSGDALAAGQENNQINYAPGELEVSLERYVDGIQMNVNFLNGTLNSSSPDSDKRIVLTETVVTTASGTFNANQRIWQTNKKIFVGVATSSKLNLNEYKLIIKNATDITKIIASSKTIIIDSVKSNISMPFKYYYHPNPNLATPMHCGYVPNVPDGSGTKDAARVDISNFSANFINRILFTSIPYAKMYNVVMRFHYIDSIIADSPKRQFLDYNFGTQKSNTINGAESMEVSFATIDFYKFLSTEIPKKTSGIIKNRTAHYMEYIITSGDETLNTFLQVNAPSNTIAQDKPFYSNIEGGVGVFGCKSKSAITKDLRDVFIDELSNNAITQNLLFNKNKTPICP